MSESLPSAVASPSRDDEKLAILFRKQTPKLLRFFRRHTKDREIAHDLAQDAFVRLLRAPDLTAVKNLEAYLHRIAYNLLVDQARDRRSEVVALSATPADAGQVVVAAPQQDSLLERDLRRRYEAALAQLTSRTRDVFLLHRLDELSYKAIAARLGISVATVEYHMTRALSHLDRTLGEK